MAVALIERLLKARITVLHWRFRLWSV